MTYGLLRRRKLAQQHLSTMVLVGLLGWLLLVLGCVPSKVQTQVAPQFNPLAISSIAVLRFQTIQAPQWGSGQSRGGVQDPEEIRTQFRLPGADQDQRSHSKQDLYSVSDMAAEAITARVEAVLRLRPGLRVVGSDESNFSEDLGETNSANSLKMIASQIGDRLKVDGVLMGRVRTYREREGTRLGAKPAAVGFEMFLVQPSDGTVLWKGEFFEEQKPLNQDVVGFFEKGGGFVTARELSEIGVQKVLATFPVGNVAPPARQ